MDQQKQEYQSPIQGDQQQQQQQQQAMHAQQHPQHQQQNVNAHGKEWQVGLCGCFGDMEACILGCCLPCVLHGRTMDRMRDPSMQTHEPLNSECLIWGGIHFFTCCAWVYNMVKRTEIREHYGIQGSAGSDCCTSFCCLCCALVQQEREVKLRAGAYAPVTQGYQGQKEGMQMPAPVHQAQHPQQQQIPIDPQQQQQAAYQAPVVPQQQSGIQPAPINPQDAPYGQKQ